MIVHNTKKNKNESLLYFFLTLPKSSSPSSTKPRVYFVRECKTSKQWILSPFAIGRSKLTRAKILGFGIPKGESRLAIKSDNWLKLMNCVAWGSYLKKEKFITDTRLYIKFNYSKKLIIMHKYLKAL